MRKKYLKNHIKYHKSRKLLNKLTLKLNSLVDNIKNKSLYRFVNYAFGH